MSAILGFIAGAYLIICAVSLVYLWSFVTLPITQWAIGNTLSAQTLALFLIGLPIWISLIIGYFKGTL